jgi:eukaryotic-like serine/threonine-protein kinase
MQLEQLGPYKVGRRLGRGGMGTVFEAVNTETDQPAAIKVLNPHLADEEGFRERFEIEIETLKKLRHPNIVRLYGFGVQDGHLYYVMELVRGRTLEEELQAGRRFDWRETTQAGIKLCRALKHAHDVGVIHRDLKPANIIVADDGEVKLTDFGIARLFGNTRLTSDGSLIGTAEYMAPEQAEGKRVTNQADLYSLGCVLFAMLAGRPPFRSKSLPEMLELQRRAEPPPVSRYAPDVPKEMERIIERLLSKSPQDRATNADLLARQLSAMEHGLSIAKQEHALTGDDPSGLDVSFASARTVPDQPEGAKTPVRGAPVPPKKGEIPYDPNAATRVADAEYFDQPARNVTAAYDPRTVREEAGNNPSAPHEEFDVAVAPAPPPPRNRFVTVEEEERLREIQARRDRGPVAAQIALLATALVTLLGLFWYFLRPPSADRLYQRIQVLATDENPGRLFDASDDVQSFLNRFPDDERAPELRKYQEEIELLQLERNFASRARLARDQPLLPIERDYMEAVSHSASSPDLAIARLRAIIDMYGAPTGNDRDRERQILQLAERQLKRLNEQVQEQAPAYLKIIDRRLAHANEIKRETPLESTRIWQSIIVLYGDKPWAAERVEMARAALADIGTSKNAD